MSKLKLKSLLKETYRKFGEKLPTLDDYMKNHEKKLEMGRVYTDSDLPPFKTETQSVKEGLITEGTRWNVGMELPNGKVVAVYGHYDGYPQWVGKILKSKYSNSSKVKLLLKLGKQGISTLDKSMKGGKDHSFDNPKKTFKPSYGILLQNQSPKNTAIFLSAMLYSKEYLFL